MSYNVLFVEDDEDFGYMLKQYLELSEMQVQWLTDPQKVEQSIEKDFSFHIGIFDVMMPHMSGFELARKIAEKYPDFPFLFLTAKDQRIDRLTGLKLGAWDYIIKPCDPEELVIRIHNIVRHSTPLLQNELIHIGGYTFDRSHLLLNHARGSYRLTKKEADLLFFLWSHNGTLVTREQILKQVWGNADFFTGRSMDVFITRLRKYLALDKNLALHSIRGIGFEVKF